jgi:hypothetical protein
MMNRLWVLLRGVYPRLEHCKDKKIVFGHHLHISDLAFQVGKTFVNQRRLYAGGGSGRETEFLELSTLLPEQFPTPTTFPASATVGMFITHSLPVINISNE